MKFSLPLLLSLVLLTGSCRQLHWQRAKVRVRSTGKVYSVEVVIENKKPYLFKEGFNEKLKAVCGREFEKLGYTLKYKDKPDYIALIRIDMDSFSTSGYAVVGGGGPTSFWRPYRKDRVYALLFDYALTSTRFSTPKWVEKNDIYFFGDIDRDTRRSLNMIKYTIRYGS